MISRITKKNIVLLSERYNHQVSYYQDIIIVSNKKNIVKIRPDVKDTFLIKYNFEGGIAEIQVQEVEIYDLLMNIFFRKSFEKISINQGTLMNIDDIYDEFGDVKEFSKRLAQLMLKNVKYYDFGGNRTLIQYYKNILILIDDICLAKSNVINLSNDTI
ncbi:MULTISPECIES: hypothetical protein [Chryseobacterium]|uniref:Uncharacterized protein n=1 Tax=Chryseobacterium camelliae TaxID=1265445 RepID=A0ABU0TNR2_9FLAO|nr:MULTISPECIES: hypothetical protein [Chryseobacterium]MDT3407465.1 hypothetical protein [Pseudacidovorax intermedius]MDQ1098683.1 hypothetical protein [Chryseobacterium camelliae]MDQ1102610.1 hypothetical protein [Chryseobacterium sp. SORGH_AS_1048]MDR6086040.1 hypothetical protein [Chryseobacterium sp. SORGH_AS_0909]MDR6130408.1 hypothetical protein [Chryseobacterium sp. SORGH_AS_1175]